MQQQLVTRLRGLNSFTSLTALGTIALIAVSYLWHIGSQTPGMSPAEASNLANSHSLHALYAHPLNAPHNFFEYLLVKLNHASPGWLRAVSAVWGIVFVVSFYKIAKSWFGRFVGWLSTLVFASTPLVVLAARTSDPSVMFLAPVTLAASYFWFTRSDNFSRQAYLALLVSAALCLYVPGGVWLLIVGLLAVRKKISTMWSSRPRWSWVAYLAALVLVSPLIASFVAHPALIKQWLLLPEAWQLLELLKSVGWMFLGLFWRSASHNDLQIGRLAVLSSAQVILLVLGLFAIWRRASLKAYGMLVIILLGVVGAGLSNTYAVLLFAVLAASVALAAGLRFLHLEWQSVFPRNPLPRGLALVIVCAAVGFSVYYGLRYSLVAWPHTVATKQTYMLK